MTLAHAVSLILVLIIGYFIGMIVNRILDNRDKAKEKRRDRENRVDSALYNIQSLDRRCEELYKRVTALEQNRTHHNI